MFLLRSRWRALLALLLLACAAAASGAERLAGPIPATVVRIIDGDTLEVSARIWLDQVVTVEVRLAGVNAAETWRPPCDAHRAPGAAATAFVTGLALAEVTLFDVEHDKYGGRVVARVVLPDERNLSELLLAEGHAVPFGVGDPWCDASPTLADASGD